MESGMREHEIAEVEGDIKEVKQEIEGLEHHEHELEEKLEHLEDEFPIQVNREHFIEKRRYVTGHDILKLVGEDDGKHGVAILRGGGEHDIPVGLDETVDLADPKNRRFKTFPDKSTEGC
jgi:predicted nuclease with TOPRIM domain